MYFDSLLLAIAYLSKRGYNTEFYLKRKGLWNASTKLFSPFIEVSIEMTIIIEEQADSDNLKCLYAVQLNDGTKGVLIDLSRTRQEIEKDIAF